MKKFINKIKETCSNIVEVVKDNYKDWIVAFTPVLIFILVMQGIIIWGFELIIKDEGLESYFGLDK